MAYTFYYKYIKKKTNLIKIKYLSINRNILINFVICFLTLTYKNKYQSFKDIGFMLGLKHLLNLFSPFYLLHHKYTQH